MNTYEYHEFTRQPRNPNRQTLNSMIFRLPAWRKRRVCSGWQGSPEDKLIDEIFLKTTRMQFSLCRFLIRGDASFVALLLSRMPPEARKRSLLNSVKKVGVILSFHLFRIPFKKGEGRGKKKKLSYLHGLDVVALDRCQNIALQQNAATSQTDLERVMWQVRSTGPFATTEPSAKRAAPTVTNSDIRDC